MREQQIFCVNGDYRQLEKYLLKNKIERVFLVCGRSLELIGLNEYFDNYKYRLGIKVEKFTDFKPNPTYEEVIQGVKKFLEFKSNCIVAIGGGSTIDVAKCIKAFATMDSEQNYLYQTIVTNDIRLIAVPTTAGTGSEATRYAVIYYEGEKHSVTDCSLIPELVLLDSGTLKTLPLYHRRTTMMDALCHAIEAIWSVNATQESDAYAVKAIEIIMHAKTSYLLNEDKGNLNMLKAAYLAGKAINIAQTTAAHAMSYKITSLYGIAHGHAVAICLSKLWDYLLKEKIYKKNSGLDKAFTKISKAMNCVEYAAAKEEYDAILIENKLLVPDLKEKDNIDILTRSVNQQRLRNFPVEVNSEVLRKIYMQMFDV